MNENARIEEEAIFKLTVDIIFKNIELSDYISFAMPLIESSDKIYNIYGNYLVYEYSVSANDVNESEKRMNLIAELIDQVPNSVVAQLGLRDKFDVV